MFEDEGIARIAECCNNLNLLDVYNCPELTNTTLRCLTQSCPNRLSLDLGLSNPYSDCRPYSDVRQAEVVGLMAAVRSRFAADELMALAKTHPALTSLGLGFSLVNDGTLTCIVECCQRLTTLDLQNCTALTDSAILALAAHCKELRSLDLQRDLWLGAHPVAFPIPTLVHTGRALTVMHYGLYCTVSDETLIELAENCNQLVCLHLGYAHNIC